jgi:hypothetical protein
VQIRSEVKMYTGTRNAGDSLRNWQLTQQLVFFFHLNVSVLCSQEHATLPIHEPSVILICFTCQVCGRGHLIFGTVPSSIQKARMRNAVTSLDLRGRYLSNAVQLCRYSLRRFCYRRVLGFPRNLSYMLTVDATLLRARMNVTNAHVIGR